ncbi:hypothetical protein [Spongiactinospora sp. TRM90649]|uniref:hypothetical protein n=1 Tax=Spongiactinospora sp. TRM90649 TaxID=3031114 RepID=UPI0023F9554A|nr:hypothetical protein [Spongiactinospora sp. TRM90649]MDF5751757.1 hypothetical protein [Spongiactinospora sp. TRM90649]
MLTNTLFAFALMTVALAVPATPAAQATATTTASAQTTAAECAVHKCEWRHWKGKWCKFCKKHGKWERMYCKHKRD